jgi:hypothetical protein
MRRLLDVAWRKNSDKSLSHYIIKREPEFTNGTRLEEVAKLLDEQDANALGLNVIWVKQFSELPDVLHEIASDYP